MTSFSHNRASYAYFNIYVKICKKTRTIFIINTIIYTTCSAIYLHIYVFAFHFLAHFLSNFLLHLKVLKNTDHFNP